MILSYSDRKFGNIPQKHRLQNSSGTKYVVQYHNLTMIKNPLYKKNSVVSNIAIIESTIQFPINFQKKNCFDSVSYA